MEIKIAVCDDEHEQAGYIKMLADKWAGENGVIAAVDMYGGAESFKAALEGGKRYDVLLLDIQMGAQNGVELAREIRRTDERLVIVFVTAYHDFIGEGYDVSALHYLTKPVDTDKFFETLGRAAKKIEKPKKTLLVEADNKSYRIPLEEIIYIEAFGHCVAVNTKNGRHDVSQNIGQMEKELDDSFLRCHRSYSVNLRYIRQISKTEILLDSGQTIPLSRRLYSFSNQAFIAHYRNKTEGN